MSKRNSKTYGCAEFVGLFMLSSLILGGFVAIIDALKGSMDVIINILLFIILIFLGWIIYEHLYFRSKKFAEIKDGIKEHINDCNELNDHIEDLKNTYTEFKQIDYGQANYVDTSNYKYKRPELKKIRGEGNIYECSLAVCRGASQQPFKYICKYFDIKPNEENLSFFENVLNNFSAAEQGKVLLINERDKILKSIEQKIPFLIRTFRKKRLITKLGFTNVDLKDLYFPKYVFRYISGGGNSSQSYEVLFDINNLDRFINYLASIIKFRNSVAGQRALMTTSLREKIKQRDKYSCKICKNSTKKEPNLLLEIDHIIPLSKKGLTTEKNLQTLCWKCNRTKGSKI